MWISSDGQDGPAAGLGVSPTESERKVVNYARERKKLKEQIAATWWPGVKSKLAKRLEQVEKQIRMLNILEMLLIRRIFEDSQNFQRCQKIG